MIHSNEAKQVEEEEEWATRALRQRLIRLRERQSFVRKCVRARPEDT